MKREDHACLLVGKFLQIWAIIEIRVEDAIGGGLELKPFQTTVVSSTLGMRQKLDLLRMLVNHAGMPQTRQDHFNEQILKVMELLHARNIVAHNSFFATDEHFEFKVFFCRTTKNKGKLGFKTISWSEGDFNSRFEEMADVNDELKELARELGSHNSLRTLAEVLAQGEGVRHMISTH